MSWLTASIAVAPSRWWSSAPWSPVCRWCWAPPRSVHSVVVHIQWWLNQGIRNELHGRLLFRCEFSQFCFASFFNVWFKGDLSGGKAYPSKDPQVCYWIPDFLNGLVEILRFLLWGSVSSVLVAATAQETVSSHLLKNTALDVGESLHGFHKNPVSELLDGLILFLSYAVQLSPCSRREFLHPIAVFQCLFETIIWLACPLRFALNKWHCFTPQAGQQLVPLLLVRPVIKTGHPLEMKDEAFPFPWFSPECLHFGCLRVAPAWLGLKGTAWRRRPSPIRVYLRCSHDGVSGATARGSRVRNPRDRGRKLACDLLCQPGLPHLVLSSGWTRFFR